jgi:hypothetical protein
MKSIGAIAVCVLAIPFTLSSPSTSSTSVATRRISRSTLEDKIRGGWAGQMIGVSYGAPAEFRSNGKIIEGDPFNSFNWKPERITNSLNQDDLYVEMTFAEVMDKRGLGATVEDYGDAFRDSKYELWHANAGARKLLNRGVRAPMSGHPTFNAHANDIDFQIESDFIGLMTPGLPQEAVKYCDRVGRVMNYGDGLYGGMFITGMYSAAFFETDVRKVVEAGLACIPAKSGFGQIVRDVLDWSAKNPDDWRKCWHLIEEKWDIDDPCPGGALADFNIDAKINGAYVALGLLYGKGDFAKTLEITTRCGQDADCNPSSAAGVLGVMLGYKGIPEIYRSGIPSIADKKFAFTNYSLDDVCRSTFTRAAQVITAAGGSASGEEIEIPAQSSKAPKLEQWKSGRPKIRIPGSDSAWRWSEQWSEHKGRIEYREEVIGRTANKSGAAAELAFEGTGVLLVGPHSQEGGRAEVMVDGQPAGTIDCFILPRTTDEDLWHVTGLKRGKHLLQIRTSDDADPRTRGFRVTILAAVIYDDK